MRWILPMVLTFSLLLFFGCSGFNRYQTDGRHILKGLDAPVKLVRDEKGMAYVHAQTLDDAMRGLGYAAAQDRLFQMSLTRLLAQGRIGELAGEKARELDVRHRTLGLYRQARIHAGMLEPETRRFFQHYIDGINDYIQTGKDTFHFAFKFAGIAPEPWTIADCLAILYFMSWDSSANLRTEVIAHLLVKRFGEQRARGIFPLNVNPDDEINRSVVTMPMPAVAGDISTDRMLLGLLEGGSHAIGSNNWVAGPAIAPGGKPVVCNDPHLDTHILPGPWYPAGLITPALRIVGVHIPGLPLMPIFRNQHVAVGVTNAYGDNQDLYVESLDPTDPDRYLEGDRSLGFTVVKERLRFRDKQAETGFKEESIVIRYTKRGPVVSKVFNGLDTDHVMSLRWAPFETMEPTMGVNGMINARSVSDIRRALRQVSMIMLNFVFADTAGEIGWHVSGRLPIRTAGDGTLPWSVTDGKDNWSGFVPFEQMPQSANPAKGWLGTCNHLTVAQNYPYYYSSTLAPGYRYRRLKQLMSSPGQKSVDDHWHYQRDTRNLMAEKLVPFMVTALGSDSRTRELAAILRQWDLHDDNDAVGAAVFHAIYERFAWLTFGDDLGQDLAKLMLQHWAFWQERFQLMVLADHAGQWFDDTTTADNVEDKREILVRAALDARTALADAFGDDPGRWRWGRIHRHSFVSPIRRKGVGHDLLGGGTYPAPGSGETLYRGGYDSSDPYRVGYDFSETYGVKLSAALRMVADLADPDKVLAVLPGGVTGRIFHPHATDQIAAYMNGDKMYWWFSDREIADHTHSVLMLMPKGKE